MQTFKKHAPGPIEHRLDFPEVGRSASKEFASRSKGVGRVGADAVLALYELAGSNTTNGQDFGGFMVMKHPRKPLSAATANAHAILQVFDGDGDGKLNKAEFQLLTELLGITAGEDEASHGIRRYQIEHLIASAPSRLASCNSLELDANAMCGAHSRPLAFPTLCASLRLAVTLAHRLGRCLMYEGCSEPVHVTKVPASSGWMRAGKGFELRGVHSGEVVQGIELRYKGNTAGVSWDPAPPVPPAFFANWTGAPRNPLLDAMRTDPMLVSEARPELTLELSGETVAQGRCLGHCLAESCYRPCGPIPICLAPCFFIHACMVRASARPDPRAPRRRPRHSG